MNSWCYLKVATLFTNAFNSIDFEAQDSKLLGSYKGTKVQFLHTVKGQDKSMASKHWKLF